MVRNDNNLPNFFILGAPKCGTTSLAKYLGAHPGVFLTDPKEPNYFSRSLNTRWHQRMCHSYQLRLDDYLQLYRPASPAQRCRGEGSTRYLRCEAALQEIREFCPAARLLVMLRDPVALVKSWHAQKLWERQETEPDLEKAWRLEPVRRRGENLPRRLKVQDALRYSQVASLGTQVEQLLRIFPREQCHLILFDDLKQDTRATYAGVLQFLGLADDGRTEFCVHNARRDLRLNRWLSHCGLARARTPSGGGSPAFELELRRYFLPEVAKLETILGRQLAGWNLGGPVAAQAAGVTTSDPPLVPLATSV